MKKLALIALLATTAHADGVALSDAFVKPYTEHLQGLGQSLHMPVTNITFDATDGGFSVTARLGALDLVDTVKTKSAGVEWATVERLIGPNLPKKAPVTDGSYMLDIIELTKKIVAAAPAEASAEALTEAIYKAGLPSRPSVMPYQSMEAGFQVAEKLPRKEREVFALAWMLLAPDAADSRPVDSAPVINGKLRFKKGKVVSTYTYNKIVAQCSSDVAYLSHQCHLTIDEMEEGDMYINDLKAAFNYVRGTGLDTTFDFNVDVGLFLPADETFLVNHRAAVPKIRARGKLSGNTLNAELVLPHLNVARRGFELFDIKPTTIKANINMDRGVGKLLVDTAGIDTQSIQIGAGELSFSLDGLTTPTTTITFAAKLEKILGGFSYGQVFGFKGLALNLSRQCDTGDVVALAMGVMAGVVPDMEPQDLIRNGRLQLTAKHTSYSLLTIDDLDLDIATQWPDWDLSVALEQAKITFEPNLELSDLKLATKGRLLADDIHLLQYDFDIDLYLAMDKALSVDFSVGKVKFFHDSSWGVLDGLSASGATGDHRGAGTLTMDMRNMSFSEHQEFIFVDHAHYDLSFMPNPAGKLALQGKAATKGLAKNGHDFADLSVQFSGLELAPKGWAALFALAVPKDYGKRIARAHNPKDEDLMVAITAVIGQGQKAQLSFMADSDAGYMKIKTTAMLDTPKPNQDLDAFMDGASSGLRIDVNLDATEAEMKKFFVDTQAFGNRGPKKREELAEINLRQLSPYFITSGNTIKSAAQLRWKNGRDYHSINGKLVYDESATHLEPPTYEEANELQLD